MLFEEPFGPCNRMSLLGRPSFWPPYRTLASPEKFQPPAAVIFGETLQFAGVKALKREIYGSQ